MPVPKANEMPLLKETSFHVIKARLPEEDGYNWLHGVALAAHKEILLASFGHNQGSENTAGEVANGTQSTDWGKRWSSLFEIDRGLLQNLAVSHGVFLPQENGLWAFHGAFFGKMKSVHTRAYRLEEESGNWLPQDIRIEKGFWPMQEPQRLKNGRWAMAGLRVIDGVGGDNNPPAIASTIGSDLTRWSLTNIPRPHSLGLWGESTIIHEGAHLICISRFRQPIALASESLDYGETWSQLRPSNLPMAASKPYSGRLSTGHAYLIANCNADNRNQRFPLTIALSSTGGMQFKRMFVIRHASHKGPGESTPNAALSYPYAVEHNGKLYVGYSNDGGRGANRNSAELAVLSIRELVAEFDEPQSRIQE